jgi:hypothetical protein
MFLFALQAKPPYYAAQSDGEEKTVGLMKTPIMHIKEKSPPKPGHPSARTHQAAPTPAPTHHTTKQPSARRGHDGKAPLTKRTRGESTRRLGLTRPGVARKHALQTTKSKRKDTDATPPALCPSYPLPPGAAPVRSLPANWAVRAVVRLPLCPAPARLPGNRSPSPPVARAGPSVGPYGACPGLAARPGPITAGAGEARRR